MASSLLQFDPFKVILDMLQDYFGFPCSVARSKPFDRIAALFGVITAVFSVTKRNNVGRNSSRTTRIAQRNPVVLSKSVPQTNRTFTNRTTIVEIVQRFQPMFVGEIGGQIEFSSSTACFTGSFYKPNFTSIGRSPFLARFAGNLWVFFGILTALFVVLGFVLLMVFPTILKHVLMAFGVGASLLVSGAILLNIFCPVLPVHFSVFVRIRRAAFFSLLVVALMAKRINACRMATELFQFCTRFPNIAVATNATDWQRFVKHLKVSFAGFANLRLGKAAKLALSAGHDSRLSLTSNYTMRQVYA